MSDWISVEDRLPDEQGHYLVIHSNDNGMWVDHFWKDGSKVGGYFGTVGAGEATHWMPLPKPPNPDPQ